MSRGDAPQATRYLRESAKVASEAGDDFWAALSLSALGMVALGQGKGEEARSSLTEGLAKRSGDRFSRYMTLYNRSVLALRSGEHDRAASLFEEGLTFSLEVGDHANVAHCLEGLAAVAVARGEADRAARLLGAAQRLREGGGLAVYTYRPDRALQEGTMATARSRLGEPGFEEARALGRAMTFERAVEYALGASATDGTPAPR
jgi:ATP/maltotriose-dependent transcriptional regulator MalT